MTDARTPTTIRFPNDFLWGAATAAHQVEGNNSLNDWWEWEQKGSVKEASGSACRHYELYQQDFDCARQLHQNAHRFSIEWSRIEPTEGVFSPEALSHYRDVMVALKDRNLEPVVTLSHFTIPAWFAHKGGWRHRNAAYYFQRYVEYVVGALGDRVRFWVTINEPMVYVYHSYVIGAWPPQMKSFGAAYAVTESLIRAHVAAYRRIHAIHAEKGFGKPSVSVATNVQVFEPCIRTFRNALACRIRDYFFNHNFVRRLLGARAVDFIGINYYSHSLVETRGWGIKNFVLDVCPGNHHPLARNSLGWDIYPEGMYTALVGFKRYGLPLFILENGICIDDDEVRWDFIRRHLQGVHRAIGAGVQVLGYIYWSLIDNYEWDKGFSPRFGLIDVDYVTFKRTIRESARRFAQVCATGELTCETKDNVRIE